MYLKSLVLAVLCCVASGFYSAGDNVVELTAANFQSEVVDSDKVWMVEFYAPWCGHCKNLIPDWKKLGKAMKGIVGVGAVDATAHEELATKYGVSGYPTIKLFGADKTNPTTFEGSSRDANGLASWTIAELKEVVKARLGIKKKAEGKKSSSSDVVEVTQATFDQEIMQFEGLALVEFYAPWCGHCKNLAPEWKKAATVLKERGVKLAAVDATVHSELARKYGVQGYPTIKVFAKGSKRGAEPTDYQGSRESEGIVREVLELLGEKPPPEAPSAVVNLNDANFDEQVLNSPDLWIVEFFAPWCGHCKSLAPHWREAANKLDGRVKLAAVDVTANQQLGQRFGVQSFPTIKVFGADKTEPSEYEGPRVTEGIVAEAETLLNDMRTPARPVVQLTDDAVFNKECGAELCVVAFLPDIRDVGLSERQAQLAILASEAKRTKKQKIGFVWSEANAQPELEKALEIGEANYPSLSIVSLKKSLRIPFVSTFTAAAVTDFVKRGSSGKAAPVKVKTVPTLAKVDAWDGKEPPKQEL